MENIIRDHLTSQDALFLVYPLKHVFHKNGTGRFNENNHFYTFDNANNKWRYKNYNRLSETINKTDSLAEDVVSLIEYDFRKGSRYNINVEGFCRINWDVMGNILSEENIREGRTILNGGESKIIWLKQFIFMYNIKHILSIRGNVINHSKLYSINKYSKEDIRGISEGNSYLVDPGKGVFFYTDKNGYVNAVMSYDRLGDFSFEMPFIRFVGNFSDVIEREAEKLYLNPRHYSPAFIDMFALN